MGAYRSCEIPAKGADIESIDDFEPFPRVSRNNYEAIVKLLREKKMEKSQ